MTDDDESRYAPSVFMDESDLSALTDTNQTLPKSEGGLIEAVKRAVVTALRDALSAINLRIDGREVYVDLEYPLLETQYPGIWVQFSPTELKRAGISQETLIKEDGVWCPVQEWQYSGRVTLSITALTSKDRDRLADLVIANLAFARTPEVILTNPRADTKQYRTLISALNTNPYVSMVLNTDIIRTGGQSVTPGVPWQDNVLAYEDSYAVDLAGQFNIKFRHDGVYELARIDILDHKVDHIDPNDSHRLAFWRDQRTSM